VLSDLRRACENRALGDVQPFGGSMSGFSGRTVLMIVALGAVGAAVASLLPSRQKQSAEGPISADSAVVSEIVGVAIVSDGDTIRIGSRHVRFDGIDAPVQGSMCGDVNVYRAAGNALRDVTRRGEVRCRISDQPDSKGRDMAICRVRDINLNEYMVAQGWARDWPLHSGGAYADEEAAARAAQLGVWAPSCPANIWTEGRDYSAR